MKSKNITYLPAVDHLRAFAALLIIFYHGGQVIASAIQYGTFFKGEHWPHTRNPFLALLVEGHTAVALFMVLSGFIFTFGCEGKTIAYSRFLTNRIIRIFPLFLFMLIFGMACYPGGYNLLAVVQALTLQANLPGTIASGPFTAMFWTVSVEFQFYLVFPFLLAFANRYGIRYLIGLMVLFATFRLLTALDPAAAEHRWDLSYFTIVGRMDQFLLGMIAAKCFVRLPKDTRWSRRLVLPLLALAIGVIFGFHRLGFHLLKVQPWMMLLWPTVEGVTWAGFILAYVSAGVLVPPAVSRGLCYLGSISFSIYLVHMIVIQYAVSAHLYFRSTNHVLRAALLTTLALTPVIVLLSSLTYYLIEKPFLEFRGSYLRGQTGPLPIVDREPQSAAA